jgi:hypothetical protein
VLRTFTGSDLFGARVTVPRGSSRVEPGTVPLLPTLLTWPTFTLALDEAGNSRREGGIHFLDADLGGRSLGDAVGANAWAKAQTYLLQRLRRLGVAATVATVIARTRLLRAVRAGLRRPSARRPRRWQAARLPWLACWPVLR